MNTTAALQTSDVLIFALLVLATLAVAGVSLINVGLGRARSAAQSLLGCLTIIAVAAIAYAALGASLAGPGGAAFSLGGKTWSWIGFSPLFLSKLAASPLDAQLGVMFGLLGAALAGIIPWGAGADRLRLLAGCAAAAVLSGFVYPLFAHWAWGGGWLAHLGSDFSMGNGFLDAGGAATIHVTGGLAALAVIWIAGPRKGKFPKEGLATAMPGHNVVYVLFGSLLALAGWMAWNAAGALLWLHDQPVSLVVNAINTVLAAAGALVATFIVTSIRFGKPDASLCANGWLAGLVTSSACSAVVSPTAALFVGVVAGIATPLLVEVLELALSIDDPSGAIVVHLCSGLWGLFAAGVFAPGKGQFMAQLVGIAALLGVILPLLYGLFALLNRFVPFRVDADGERLGMDLHELGGGAYPEFVLHRDDSYR